MTLNFLPELWHSRSLIILLAFNDVKIRYKSSVLGFLWTFLEPLLMLTVLYFVFTTIITTDIENFALYLLLGLLVWYMFSRATSMGLSSLITKSGMIQRINFRREIVVISSCLTAFIIMSFEFAAFGVFVVALQFVPPLTAVVLPLLLIDLFFLCVGVALILSVLNVFFRDIKFIWQVLVQAGFFLHPIFYRLEGLPENIRMILELSPVAHILNAVRDVVLYDSLPSVDSSLYIVGTTLAFVVVGYFVFRLKDKKIVEEV